MSEVTHADIAMMTASLREQNQVAVACRTANVLLETRCVFLLIAKHCPLCERPLGTDLVCSNCYDGTGELGRYSRGSADEHVNTAVELKLEELFSLEELKAHLNWGGK